MASSAEKLQRLEAAGQLKPEATSKQEIEGFLASARELLTDSQNSQLSAASRFRLAYDAAYALAHAALRAHGLRPSQEKGHRAIVFQCLAHTVGAAPDIWATLSKAHSRRNASVYGGLIDVSKSEAEDLVATTARLSALVKSWLNKHRPDLR